MNNGCFSEYGAYAVSLKELEKKYVVKFTMKKVITVLKYNIK